MVKCDKFGGSASQVNASLRFSEAWSLHEKRQSVPVCQGWKLPPMTSFFVHGIPQSQGSARAFMAGGRPIITTTNRKLGDWRRLVADAAQEHAQIHEGPLQMVITFYLPRPKSLGKKVTLPAKRPDIDKLLRACLDALTGVMYDDDAQVTLVEVAKRYADDEGPGVWISIGRDGGY